MILNHPHGARAITTTVKNAAGLDPNNPKKTRKNAYLMNNLYNTIPMFICYKVKMLSLNVEFFFCKCWLNIIHQLK